MLKRFTYAILSILLALSNLVTVSVLGTGENRQKVSSENRHF